MTEVDQQWVERLQVLGRAQARYLWVLFIVSIFYWALHAQIVSGVDGATVEAPLIGIQVSGPATWATGPITISVLLLIIWGALRAYSRARDEAGIDAADRGGEPYDVTPNAIDLAAYTVPGTWPPLGHVLYFAYPVAVTIPLIEAVVILVRLWPRVTSITGGAYLFWLGCFMTAVAGVVVLLFWRGRVRRKLEAFNDWRGETA